MAFVFKKLFFVTHSFMILGKSINLFDSPFFFNLEMTVFAYQSHKVKRINMVMIHVTILFIFLSFENGIFFLISFDCG